MKTIHVVPDSDGGWNIKKGGQEKSLVHVDLKKEAIDQAREISRGLHGELIIHNRDGKIARHDSHGNDPCPPKDKNIT